MKSRQGLDVLLVSLYFARQILSGSISYSPSTSTCMKLIAFKVMLTFDVCVRVCAQMPELNIASLENQVQMHIMGLNTFLTFCFDINANVKCEHSIKHSFYIYLDSSALLIYLMNTFR